MSISKWKGKKSVFENEGEVECVSDIKGDSYLNKREREERGREREREGEREEKRDKEKESGIRQKKRSPFVTNFFALKFSTRTRSYFSLNHLATVL